jgi:hypothetical protein
MRSAGGRLRSAKWLFAAGLSAALVSLWSAEARASLTSSERAQIRDFVAGARAENASRVRSLVARTDLTADESANALVEATKPVAFTPQRARFFQEMTFASSSAASRPVLVRALVRGLLARADAVHHQFVGGLDHEPRAIAELMAIYAFVDERVANAGNPTPVAADGANGISRAAYEDCAKALGAHIDGNRRWLKGSGQIPAAVAPLRAQAQVTLLDLSPDRTTRYVDVAAMLGLSTARSDLLVRHGLLLADAGNVDDAHVSRVGAWLSVLPDGRAGASVLYASPSSSVLRARGQVLAVSPGASPYPFGEEVSPGPWDAELARLLAPIVQRATVKALAARPTFAAIVTRDVTATKGEASRMLGRPAAPSVDHVLSAAVLALVVDGRRAIDSAFARHLVGTNEPAALLSDALSVLSAQAGAGDKVHVGGPDGDVELTGVKSAASGDVTAFTLDGAAFTLERVSPAFAVGAVKRAGVPVSLAHLKTARFPVLDGALWGAAGAPTFGRLRGTPRAGVGSGGTGKDGRRGATVRMVGVSGSGFDAIGTTPPADSMSVEAELTVTGGRGGIALRASAARDGLRGVGVLVSGGKLELVSFGDKGAETPLAPPAELPAMPARVVVTLKGTDIEVKAGGKTLKGKVPEQLRRGQFAVVAARGVSVQLSDLSLRK